MGVQVVVVFEEVVKGHALLMVADLFEVDLDEVRIGLGDEFLEFLLEFLEVGEVFESVLDQGVGVVDLFAFVDDVESFSVLAFPVTQYLLLFKRAICCALRPA